MNVRVNYCLIDILDLNNDGSFNPCLNDSSLTPSIGGNDLSTIVVKFEINTLLYYMNHATSYTTPLIDCLLKRIQSTFLLV